MIAGLCLGVLIWVGLVVICLPALVSRVNKLEEEPQ